MLKCIEVHRDGVEAEIYKTYESAAERLQMTPMSLRTALSNGGGEMHRKSTPIGTVVVIRRQHPLPIMSKTWRVVLTLSQAGATTLTALFPSENHAAKHMRIPVRKLRRLIRNDDFVQVEAGEVRAAYAPPGTLETEEELAGVTVMPEKP